MTDLYKSYAITVRPRSGISDETIDEIIKWFKKKDYGMVVIELENEARHLHGQIWLNDAVARGTICTALVRICERTVKDWDRAQVKVLRQGVKIAYSDWNDNYLVDNESKDDANIKYDNVPDKTSDYYPTQEDQDRVKAKHNAVDLKYHELSIKYLDWLGNRKSRLGLCAEFLSWAMFEGRVIRVIEDPKRRQWTCTCLYRYCEQWGFYEDCLTKEEAEHEKFIRDMLNKEHEQENQEDLFVRD